MIVIEDAADVSKKDGALMGSPLRSPRFKILHLGEEIKELLTAEVAEQTLKIADFCCANLVVLIIQRLACISPKCMRSTAFQSSTS